MFENLKPLGNRVLLKLQPIENKTESGLFLPDSASDKPQVGTVIAKGPGSRSADGCSIIPIQLNIGDTVYFGKYNGLQASDDLLIIREDEILGILDGIN